MHSLCHSRPDLRAKLVEQLLSEDIERQSMYPKKQAMA